MIPPISRAHQGASGVGPSKNAASSRTLAEFLEGCWREQPLPAAVEPAQLDALLDTLIGAGTGALAWRRLRHSALARHPAALVLQKAHFKHLLDTRMQEQKIARAFELLQAEGIEALLIKGWATARQYPEAGLRPIGDIDLLIRPADIAATERVLGIRVDDDTNSQWDIKSAVPALYNLPIEELFARQKVEKLGEVEVATLGAEDHLRILCLHFLKHGAWRPLWLCDIAAALEFRPDNFDWDICLGHDKRSDERRSDGRRSGDAIACTLALAHQLLGASIEGTPLESRGMALPAWLLPAVLKAWETPKSSQHLPNPLLIHAVRRRRGILREALKRWPNPIEAVMRWRMPLSFPPLPLQVATFAALILHFVKRSGRSPRGE